MIKKVLPQDYFTEFYPKEPKIKVAQNNELKRLIEGLKQRTEKLEKESQKKPQEKIVYVSWPYQIGQGGNSTNNSGEIPYGLIALVCVTGIIIVGIVAIVIGGRK